MRADFYTKNDTNYRSTPLPIAIKLKAELNVRILYFKSDTLIPSTCEHHHTADIVDFFIVPTHKKKFISS